MSSKLPPLNFDDDIENYDAYEEKRKLDFPMCDHSSVEIIDGELRCPRCGAGWTGTGIHEAYKLLRG